MARMPTGDPVRGAGQWGWGRDALSSLPSFRFSNFRKRKQGFEVTPNNLNGCREVLCFTHFAVTGLPSSWRARHCGKKWGRGPAGGVRGGAGGERSWVRRRCFVSPGHRGSYRCVLRKVFGDLAELGQDGRWQEAPRHLFVCWLGIRSISLNRYPVFKALAGEFPTLKKPSQGG